MASAQATAEQVERILAARSKNRLFRSLVYVIVLALVVWSVNTTIVEDTDWKRMGSVSSVLESVAEFIGFDFGLFPNLLEPAIETIMVADAGNAARRGDLRTGDLVRRAQHHAIHADHLPSGAADDDAQPFHS